MAVVVAVNEPCEERVIWSYRIEALHRVAKIAPSTDGPMVPLEA